MSDVTLARIETRLDRIEDWSKNIDIQRSAEAVEMKHLEEAMIGFRSDFNDFRKDVRSTVIWFLVVFGTVLVGAFARWLLSGGLMGV